MAESMQQPDDSRPSASHTSGSQTTQVAVEQALLVATGPDHPGILDEISHYVADRSARMEAVRVSNLRGRFGMLMLVSAAPEALKHLGRDLHILAERTGVRASLEAADAEDGGQTTSTCFRLTADGGVGSGDESEALRQISNLLKVLNINILNVETSRTAGRGFQMVMEIDVPRDIPVAKLRELVAQLFGEMGVQWQLAAVHPDESSGEKAC